MHPGNRLERLHLLRDRLERMPASPDRDWMLQEVRARAVDVESGVQPRPMRPLEVDADVATPHPEPAERPERRTVDVAAPMATPAPRRPPEIRAVAAPVAPSPPQAVPSPPFVAVHPPRPAARADSVDLLEDGALLCLDDPSPPDAGASSRPWLRGLRG